MRGRRFGPGKRTRFVAPAAPFFQRVKRTDPRGEWPMPFWIGRLRVEQARRYWLKQNRIRTVEFMHALGSALTGKKPAMH
jgi:hypothetical protein